MTAASDLIAKEAEILHKIRMRYVVLRAVARELHKRSRGKLFEIRDEHVWRLLSDSYRCLVIDFSSWAKSTRDKGGLFGKLRAHHLRDFGPPPEPDAHPGTFSTPNMETARERERVFKKRFPDAVAGGRVRPADLEKLKDLLTSIAEPVTADRDEYRAHPFEKTAKRARVRETSLPDWQPIFEAAQQLLNDLTFISDGTRRSFHDNLALHHPESSAQQVTDMILFGSACPLDNSSGLESELHKATGKSPEQHREELYERAHEAHDRVSDKSLAFNSFSILDEMDDPS